MYIWLFSRSVGAESAMTRNTRGLTRSVIALMVPPLPAPSRPSNTMHTLSPLYFTHSCSLTSSTCSFDSCLAYALPLSFSVGAASFALAPPLPFFFRFIAVSSVVDGSLSPWATAAILAFGPIGAANRGRERREVSHICAEIHATPAEGAL